MTETRHTTTLDIQVDDRQIEQLGQTLDRALSVKTIEAFTKMMERQSSVLTKLIQQQEQLRHTLERGRKESKDAADEEEKRKPLSFMQTVGATGIGTFLGQAAHTVGGRLWGIGGASVRGGMSEAVMRSIPGGSLAADVSGGAQQYYQQGIAAAEARMGGYGRTGLGAGPMNAAMGGWGARMGLDPTQTPGLLADAANQTGLTGGPLSRVAPAVVGAQRFAGIASAGGVVGAAGEAGGDVSSSRALSLIKETIGSALEAGVREARLDQYFSGLASFVEQMRTQGILLEPETVNALVRGIGQTNAKSFQGMAGLVAAKGMMGGVTRAMGGNDLGTAIMMKITGVTEGRNYFEAAEDVEQHPAKYVPRFIGKIQELSGGKMQPGQLGAIIKNTFERMGYNMSWKNARELGQMDPSMIAAQMNQQSSDEAATSGGAFLGSRMIRAPLGPLPAEAGRRMQEIGLGESGPVVKLSQHLLQLDITVATKLLPGMAKLTDALVTDSARGVKKLIDASGFNDEDKRTSRESSLIHDPSFKLSDYGHGLRIALDTISDAVMGLEKEDGPQSRGSSGVWEPRQGNPGASGSWDSTDSSGSAAEHLKQIAVHAQAAADALGNQANKPDMEFTLSEADLSGGN